MSRGHRVLVSRLLEYLTPCHGLNVPTGDFQEAVLTGGDEVQTEHLEDRDLTYHVHRVRYFLQQLRAGAALDPIELDNYCDGGRVYPYPVLLDGHHRLIAAEIHKATSLRAHYGGRVDLLRYLQGHRKTAPEM